MHESTPVATRRDVLTGLLGGAALAAVGSPLLAAPGRARVIRVQSEAVWRGESRDAKVVARMVDAGVKAFLGAASPEAAWKQLFRPGMRVGLKINLLGRPLAYTAREVTEAVTAGAVTAGVKPSDILVWDRFRDHFGPTVYVPGPGRMGESIVVGGEYDPARTAPTSGGPCPVDTIPVHRTDVTVSLPVLKDHGGAGVTLALKNIAFGAYRHHSSAHQGGCDPYIAEACAHFPTVARVPLIVLDATEGTFDGGPRPPSRATMWHENAIYVASDPVALDVVCRRVVLERRRLAGLRDISRQCRHVETAAGKGLGVGDPALIDTVTITL